MSMIANLLQLTPDQLAQLIADPSRVEAFIDPEGDEGNLGIDLDKAWHGIHFLLTGQAWGGDPPLANVVVGGTEIGDDIGYGPAHYLTADEVRAVAAALRDITPEKLRAKYVAAELTQHEIYPEIWDDPEDDALGYLIAYYETLRDYYLDAAANNKAMLLFLN